MMTRTVHVAQAAIDLAEIQMQGRVESAHRTGEPRL